jgi:hypothetical protein
MNTLEQDGQTIASGEEGNAGPLVPVAFRERLAKIGDDDE